MCENAFEIKLHFNRVMLESFQQTTECEPTIISNSGWLVT